MGILNWLRGSPSPRNLLDEPVPTPLPERQPYTGTPEEKQKLEAFMRELEDLRTKYGLDYIVACGAIESPDKEDAVMSLYVKGEKVDNLFAMLEKTAETLALSAFKKREEAQSETQQ